jgi:hypothetical protein
LFAKNHTNADLIPNIFVFSLLGEYLFQKTMEPCDADINIMFILKEMKNKFYILAASL